MFHSMQGWRTAQRLQQQYEFSHVILRSIFIIDLLQIEKRLRRGPGLFLLLLHERA